MKTHKPWCETDLRLARQAAAFLTSKLHTWYEQQRRLGHRPSEVEYLTATMFGTKNKPVTKLKGRKLNGYLGSSQVVSYQTAAMIFGGVLSFACALGRCWSMWIFWPPSPTCQGAMLAITWNVSV